MKNALIILFLSIVTCTSYSQSKKLVGSWILRDSVEAMQFFATDDGTIKHRSGVAGEDIWGKKPRDGTYILDEKGKLIITWSDRTIEHGNVKFENSFKTAKIRFTNRNKPKKTHLFLKVVDEEVLPAN